MRQALSESAVEGNLCTPSFLLNWPGSGYKSRGHNARSSEVGHGVAGNYRQTGREVRVTNLAPASNPGAELHSGPGIRPIRLGRSVSVRTDHLALGPGGKLPDRDLVRARLEEVHRAVGE